MRADNRARVRRLMGRIRAGTMSGSPTRLGIFGSLGMMGEAIEKLNLKLQEYGHTNNIYGMGNPENFDRAMFAAQLGMRAGSATGANLVNKFVRDHYQYVQSPAIKALGSTGGKFSNILSDYIGTREEIRRSYGDIGAQIGGAVAFGVHLAMNTVKLGSLAIDATGIGVPVGLLLFALSTLVDVGVGAAAAWGGRKLGEKFAESSGKIDKYSAPNLANNLIQIIPENIQNFKEVAASVIDQPWYTGNFESYLGAMSRVQEAGPASLEQLGMNVEEVGSLYANTRKNINVAPANVGSYTKTIGRIKSVSGVDVTGILGEISVGSGLTVTPNYARDIDQTASAFTTFFNAIFKGSNMTTVMGLGLVESLAGLANRFSDRHIGAKDTPTLFAGVQKFVAQNMNAKNATNTETTGKVVDIMDRILMGSSTNPDKMSSPIASLITNYSGISALNAHRGIDAGSFQKLTAGLEGLYKFGDGNKIDAKTGVLTLDKQGDIAMKSLIRDISNPVDQGGLGASIDDAMLLGKFLVAYKNNPNLDFDAAAKDPRFNTLLQKQAEVITDDDVYSVVSSDTKIADNYMSLANKFTVDYITIGNAVAARSTQLTEQIAQGTLDLLVSYYKITHKGFDGMEEGTGYSADPRPSGANYGGGINSPGWTGPAKTVGKALVAGAGFKEKIKFAADAANIELKTLYAFFGAESTFGQNTQNPKGYVGMGQIGADAQADVNRTYHLNLDRFNEHDNILIAAYYIKIIQNSMQRFKEYSAKKGITLRFDPNDPRVVYAAYNWGMGNLQNYIAGHGGFDPDNAPIAETRIGIGNVEAAMLGFDYGNNPLPDNGDTSMTGPTTAMTTGNGGVWHFDQNQKYSGKKSGTTTYLNMSGVTTERGLQTARYMQRLYRTSANTNDEFYKACAGVANAALNAAGIFAYRAGTARGDFNRWQGGARSGAVMTFAEAKRLGFQPGDLLYVADGRSEGNHVGIVDEDGTILQAGTAYDKERQSNMIRTDITEFTWNGEDHIYVVRPSIDADNDGNVTPAEAAAGKVAAAVTTTTKAQKAAFQKQVKTKALLANVRYADGTSDFYIKNTNGLGISKSRADRIKAKEAAIEKALGIKPDALIIDATETNGGVLLHIQVNSGIEDVGGVASEILRIIEGIK